MTSYIEVDGKSLEVAMLGPPPDAGKTIVLLHEGLGSIAMWRDFPMALTQVTGMGVIAYSRAGYGNSDPADLPRDIDYMTDEAARVLPQVLDAVGFRSGVLLGHSDGATIAALHAGTVFDPRVRGLILMAPHFFTEPMGLAAIAAAREAFETTDMPTRLGKYHRDADHTFRGWNDAWLNPSFEDWNVTDAVDHIRVPTLAIQGRDDAYGTLAQISALETRSYAPVETLILENCGHNPHSEARDIVLPAISDFIARLAQIDAF